MKKIIFIFVALLSHESQIFAAQQCNPDVATKLDQYFRELPICMGEKIVQNRSIHITHCTVLPGPAKHLTGQIDSYCGLFNITDRNRKTRFKPINPEHAKLFCEMIKLQDNKIEKDQQKFWRVAEDLGYPTAEQNEGISAHTFLSIDESKK